MTNPTQQPNRPQAEPNPTADTRKGEGHQEDTSVLSRLNAELQSTIRDGVKLNWYNVRDTEQGLSLLGAIALLQEQNAQPNWNRWLFMRARADEYLLGQATIVAMRRIRRESAELTPECHTEIDWHYIITGTRTESEGDACLSTA